MVVSLPAATLKQDCALSFVILKQKTAITTRSTIFFISLLIYGFCGFEVTKFLEVKIKTGCKR
jgi:hypothetical protein